MTVSENLSLTAPEKNAIEELRSKIQDDFGKNVYNDDYILYRFLKPQKFNVTQAECMLRKAMQWRKEFGYDTIVEDYTPPLVLRNYMKHARFCFDKEGNAVGYNPMGRYDPKGIYMSAKYIDIEKTLFQQIETDDMMQRERIKGTNKLLPGHSFIWDIEGLTFANATDKRAIELLIKLVNVYQNYYPERIKAIYIINASAYFTLPFSVLKTFLHGSVLDKIQIFGEEGWKEELLKVIDEQDLPVCLGGKRTDPDGNPLCKTILNQGGPIDEKYYIHKSQNPLSQAPDVQKLVLQRASFSEIEVAIEEAGSLIEWEFETRTRDIGFGLFFKEDVDGEEKITELVPLLRLDTEQFAETGMYKCEKAGTYVILFDNSYSWIRSKEVYYRTKVVTPKEHEARMKDA